MKARFAYIRRRVGLGTVVQTVIHAGLAAAPLPRKTKARLKGCVGCTRRVQRLNTDFPNINPLAPR